MDAVEPLLGVTIVEGLGTKIDSGTGKLEHSRTYGLALLVAEKRGKGESSDISQPSPDIRRCVYGL
jgi:hypothetical protein